MEKSPSITKIASALITFQIKVGKIAKDATNPFFKSKYASLSNIQDAIAEPLNESGLSYMQFPDGLHGLTTIIMHDSGEWLQSTYTMQPVKNDPQGIGSAITYQKRYALAGALALNIDDDDDANQATHGSKEPVKKTEDTRLRDINSYVAKLALCNDVDELTMLKSTCPEFVVESPIFKRAGIKRFAELTKVPQ